MKIRIDVECTPDEFKELFIPSEKQAEFASQFQQAMMQGMQRAMMQGMQNTFSQQFVNPFFTTTARDNRD